MLSSRHIILRWLACCALCLMPAALGALYAQQLHTTIQYRCPATIKLPEGISSILVVNNSPEQPADFGHQIVRNGQTALADSVRLAEAPLQCLFYLSTALADQEYFSEVSLLEQPQPTGTTFYARKRLPDLMADSLIAAYGVDALLVLNQIVIYDLRESYLTDQDDYYAYLEAYCTTQWTVHRAQTATRQFATTDTLYWEGRRGSELSALQSLPDRQTALLDMAAYVGEHLAKKIAPYWVSADRYLYRSDDEQILAGIDFFRQQQWSVAARTWSVAYEAGKNARRQQALTNAAYAAANCAVACEMTESFAEAVSWADKAIELFGRMNTTDAAQQVVNLRYYRSQLNERWYFRF